MNGRPPVPYSEVFGQRFPKLPADRFRYRKRSTCCVFGKHFEEGNFFRVYGFF
jgi:hypothetical protein